MTESEAIEKLKNMRLYMQIEDKNNDCKFTEDDYKANEMAINALEKQIAKKPDRWESGYACCCSCKRGIVREDNYCCYCGQKIDWSE